MAEAKVLATIDRTDTEQLQISDVEEFAGFGVRAIVNRKEVLVGNWRLLLEHHISLPNNIETEQFVLQRFFTSIINGKYIKYT